MGYDRMQGYRGDTATGAPTVPDLLPRAPSPLLLEPGNYGLVSNTGSP